MSEKLTVKGTIKTILEVESGTSKAGKEWQKQGFVIDTGAEFNPEVCFSMFGEKKLEMLAKFTEGQNVEVNFNVSSREFNGKYYHNLDAWFIKDAQSDQTNSENETVEDDDLPFA